MKRVLGRRGVAAAVVVVVAAVVGGIAYASIPDANGVIHGCYRKTTGELIVATSDKGCEEGWKPLDWSQSGPTGLTGPTGPTGPTGVTGPTGPTGALSSAYVDAFVSTTQPVAGTVPFDTTVIGSGIVIGALPDKTFTVTMSGVYQVTVDLQGDSGTNTTAQLTVNGVGVVPPLRLGCGVFSNFGDCTFTRLLSVSAGDVIRLVFVAGGQVGAGSGITIVRIA